MTELTTDIATLAAPGYFLRKRRIKLGWSIEKIAYTLHLSTAQIEAIENDDFAYFSSTTYLLGYWRSYSRLLEIDIDQSIELHRQQLQNSHSSIKVEKNHQRTHRDQEKNRKVSAIVFCLLSAIFLAGIWLWQNPEDNPLSQWVDNLSNRQLVRLNLQKEQSGTMESQEIAVPSQPSVPVEQPETVLPEPNFTEEPPSPPATEHAQSNAVVATPESDRPAETQSDRVTVEETVAAVSRLESVTTDEQAVTVAQETIVEDSQPSPDEPESTVVEQLATIEPVTATNTPVPVVESGSTASATDDSAVLNGQQETPDTLPNTVPPVVDALTVSADVVSPSVTISQAPSGDAPLVPETGGPAFAESGEGFVESALSPNQIELVVDRETWIDVRDVTGEKLVYRTVNKGQVLKLTGVPPFYVFIGTASGVAVNYLGEPVQFTTHSSGLFARFRVGEVQQ